MEKTVGFFSYSRRKERIRTSKLLHWSSLPSAVMHLSPHLKFPPGLPHSRIFLRGLSGISQVHQDKRETMGLGFKSLIREHFRNMNWLNNLNVSQQCTHGEHNNDGQLQSEHQQEQSQQVNGSGYFTLHGTYEATSTKLYPVLGPLE